MQLRALMLLGVVIASTSRISAQSAGDIKLPCAASSNSILVVGFLGGFERWDDPHRGIRKVALSLQSLRLPHLYVATFENHHREMAADAIRCFVGSKSNQSDTPRPRVILYGQSWGGAAVVHVARELANSAIRVELTIQVDSVGLHDRLIPPNVRNAANMFQRDLFGIGGRDRILAEDSRSTRILENTQMWYLFRPYATLDASDASWLRRTFGGSHAKMELDDAVWAHVELLVLAAINNQL